MKIRFLIILFFIVIAAIVSIGGNYYIYSVSSDISQEEKLNHLETAAESRADHIETYLSQNIEKLKLITSRTKLRNVLKDYNTNPSQELKDVMRGIILDAKEPIEDFKRVCIVDMTGIIITSTDVDKCNMDISDKSFFIGGKEKYGNYVEMEEGAHHLFVSGPIILDGETIGVGITMTDLDYLESIVRGRSGLGETGEVLVAIQHENGDIHWLFERLFEEEANSNIEDIAIPMKEAIKGRNLLFGKTIDYRNMEVMAASQSIETFSGQPFGLVAKIDISEALGEKKKALTQTILFIILFIVVLVGLIGYYISKLISEPLKKLTWDVNEITKGKLDLELEESRIDEINHLTESLNRILASLKLAILRVGASKAELGLGRNIAAREEAEDRYAKLFENAKDSIMVINPRTKKIFDMNRAAELLVGYTKEELVGKSVQTLHSKDRAKEMMLLLKSYATGKKTGKSHLYLRTKEGKNIKVEANIGKIKINGEDYLQGVLRKKIVSKKLK